MAPAKIPAGCEQALGKISRLLPQSGQTADALALSLVHTNKTLKRLSAQGLMQWKHGWCFIPDVGALAEIAKFDLNQPRKRPLL